MHNVNVDALEQTARTAQSDPAALKQRVTFDGEWQTGGGPQFAATIPVPNGDPVTFQADFPPPMGGTGSAPNPLAYCFWGGMACYAMTYAQEAAKQGVQLRALHARAEAEVDMTRALGVTDNPPSSASTGTSTSTPTPPPRSSKSSRDSPTTSAPASTACETPSNSPPISRPDDPPDRKRGACVFEGHMNTGWGIIAIAAMVAMMGGMGWMMWSMMRGSGTEAEAATEDPIAVLKTRYARGELTTDEYQERLRALTGPDG